MTSDERREIARRLRTAAKTKSNSADYLWKRLEIAVNGWRFGDGIDDSYVFDNDVLARLADLIDPTCEVESVGPIRAGEFNQAIGSAFHLTCGHTAWRACTDEPPVYCEECGARVVDDD
jgi:hypothetical protein